MRYSVNQTSSPTYEPVTLSECKDDLEILQSETRHDDKITGYLLGAVNDAENFTGQLFAQRNVTVNYDTFSEYMSMPVHPIVSITSIKYYDTDNTLQTLSTSSYESDLDAFQPLIRITSIPSVKDRLNAVQINLVCGHNSNNTPIDADLVPDSIKKAIRFKVYQDFLNRGENSEDVKKSFENILMFYRWTRI